MLASGLAGVPSRSVDAGDGVVRCARGRSLPGRTRGGSAPGRGVRWRGLPRPPSRRSRLNRGAALPNGLKWKRHAVLARRAGTQQGDIPRAAHRKKHDVAMVGASPACEHSVALPLQPVRRRRAPLRPRAPEASRQPLHRTPRPGADPARVLTSRTWPRTWDDPSPAATDLYGTPANPEASIDVTRNATHVRPTRSSARGWTRGRRRPAGNVIAIDVAVGVSPWATGSPAPRGSTSPRLRIPRRPRRRPYERSARAHAGAAPLSRRDGVATPPAFPTSWPRWLSGSPTGAPRRSSGSSTAGLAPCRRRSSSLTRRT